MSNNNAKFMYVCKVIARNYKMYQPDSIGIKTKFLIKFLQYLSLTPKKKYIEETEKEIFHN